MKLSVKKIETLAIGKTVCDSRNLYFTKTSSNGGKWSFRYQRDGKSREMGLGPYPVITIDKARYKAQQNLILLYEGKNPLVIKQEAKEKDKARKSLKFSSIAEQYIERNRSEWTSKKHEQGWLSTLRRYAYPILDQKPLANLDTTDVLHVLEPLWREKRSTARKLQGRIKMIFAAAIASQQYTGDNPAKWEDHLSHHFSLQTNKHIIKHHRALDFAQAPIFYADLCKILTMTSHALRFTMLTAARTSEVIYATPREFDFQRMLWRVPANRMKARKPHIVPLSEQAADIVENCLTSNNLPFLFHSRNPEKSLSNMAMLTFIKKKLNHYDTTVHGLRSTFRTWAGEQGIYDSGIIEFALAHQLNERIEGAYLRSELVEPRRKLMQDWANFVEVTDPKH